MAAAEMDLLQSSGLRFATWAVTNHSYGSVQPGWNALRQHAIHGQNYTYATISSRLLGSSHAATPAFA